MDFKFLVPNEIIIRRGGASDIGKICGKYARRVCIFRYGERFYTSGTYDKIKKSLDAENIESFIFYHVKGEPSPEVINDAAEFIRENGCDGALAIGGGSPIDAAKAACALAPNGKDIMDYIEGFSPQKFQNRPLPVIAVPTTAGTGSECTKNSVITSKGNFKNSVRDDSMLPVAAVLDAELMLDVPRDVTATSGADCLCQLIESYVTKFANPFTDAIAIHFTKTAYDNLRRAYDNGQDIDAREQMALSACASGMAMANGGLGAAHGIAAGMGALTPLSHGLICGIILPHVIKFNIGKNILKYADLSRALTGKNYENDQQAAYDLIRLTEELNRHIGIPSDFKRSGISRSDIPKIAKAAMGSSMSKNPVDVTQHECEELLSDLI